MTHNFCQEFGLDIVERDFFGYYLPRTDLREVWGLYPISIREFFLFALYSSVIVYQKPTFEQTTMFLDYLSSYYDIDSQLWQDIMGEMMESLNSVDDL